MTIVSLDGGLGHQLFSYCAARRLAAKHGSTVAMDVRAYQHFPKHEFGLQHFAVQAAVLRHEDASELVHRSDRDVRPVHAQHLHVDPTVLTLESPDVWMTGDYLSQDYFHDVEDVLREELRRTSAPSDYALQVQAHLDELVARGYEPVAVHVRRGDRLTEPHLAAALGTCTDEYYATALATTARLVTNPWYVIFSDDTAWVQEHWAGEGRTVTAPPPGTPAVDDLMLMSACKHHVIANSCFSWWAAWLGKHDDQVVIGPRPFFADRSHNSEDVLLREWIGVGSIPRPSASR